MLAPRQSRPGSGESWCDCLHLVLVLDSLLCTRCLRCQGIPGEPRQTSSEPPDWLAVLTGWMKTDPLFSGGTIDLVNLKIFYYKSPPSPPLPPWHGDVRIGVEWWAGSTNIQHVLFRREDLAVDENVLWSDLSK